MASSLSVANESSQSPQIRVAVKRHIGESVLFERLRAGKALFRLGRGFSHQLIVEQSSLDVSDLDKPEVGILRPTHTGPPI